MYFGYLHDCRNTQLVVAMSIKTKEAHALCRNLADRPGPWDGQNDDVIKAWHQDDLSWSLSPSKTHCLIDFGTLSLGGCGGHPMRPKLNLKNKGQMSTPNEYTDNFKSNLTCIFLSVGTKLKKHFALGHGVQ